jgi:hypothetical protein
MRRTSKYVGVVCGLMILSCTSKNEDSKSAVNQASTTSGDATAGTVTQSTTGIDLEAFAPIELDEDTSKSIPLKISTTTAGSIRIDVMDHPRFGDVVVDEASKSVKYTPDLNYSGRDSFAIRVTEGTNQSAARSVSVKVKPVDDSPICLPQSFGAKTASEIRSSIVCQDVDSPSISYAISTSPTKGSLTLTGSTFTYTLKSGQVEDDQFEVTATADGKTSKPAIIKILPNLVGDKPVANNLSMNCVEDELCAAKLGGSSNIPDQGFHFEVTRQPRSFTASLDISSGNLTLNLPENWNGSDQFSYRVRSGDKWSDDVNVPIVVAAVNDRPVISVSSSQEVTFATDEDTSKQFTFDINDIESSPNDLEVVVNQAANNGTVQIDFDQRKLTYMPSLNYTGSDQFSVHVCEKNSSPAFCSVPVIFQATINAVNDAPVALSPGLAITEDSPETICFEKHQLADDVDNEISTLVITTPGRQVGVTSEPERICYKAPSNFNGSEVITYVVRDPQGLVTPGSINVQVSGVEDPAEFNQALLTCILQEDANGSCTVSASDPDGAVRYELVSESVAPLRLEGWQIADESFPSQGVLRLIPPSNFFGMRSVAIRAGAGSGMESATLNLDVRNVRDNPVWLETPMSNISTISGTTEILFKAKSIDRLNPLKFTLNITSNVQACDYSKEDIREGEMKVKFTCRIGYVEYTVDVSDGLSAPRFVGSVSLNPPLSSPSSVGLGWIINSRGHYVSNVYDQNYVSACLIYIIPSGSSKMKIIFSTKSEYNYDFLTARSGLFTTESRFLSTLRLDPYAASSGRDGEWELAISSTDSKASVCFSKDGSYSGSESAEFTVKSVQFL